MPARHANLPGGAGGHGPIPAGRVSGADQRPAVALTPGMAAPIPQALASAPVRGHLIVAGVPEGALAALPALLRAACPDWTVGEVPAFTPVVAPVPGPVPPATVLVHLPADPASVIRAAEAFATFDGQDDLLILNISLSAAATDWQGQRDAALLAAFTRHAARVWAPQSVRVNLLSIGPTLLKAANAPGPAGCVADVAGMIRHMQGWRSMTGQTLQLGLG